ncbi:MULTISPECIES: DUF6471 domain-containing protein [unclassified Sphingomonas]|uniref:DUF6471 domain-containing protein n=1 Tax=unclassified Sphingomonas TaxID=196159 RepID=UPI0035A81E98
MHKKACDAWFARKLVGVGGMDSEPNIRNKISWGKFTAVLLIQCLEAVSVEALSL